MHHTYGSYLGRMIHPLGRRIQPAVGRRMQRAWLEFAGAAWAATSDPASQPSEDWPRYEVPRRATRVIKTMRDVVVDDPDRERREAWAGLY